MKILYGYKNSRFLQHLHFSFVLRVTKQQNQQRNWPNVSN